MQSMKSYTLNLRGNLYSLDQPKVMGILNVTPDSFFAESRTPDVPQIESRVRAMLAEGADMIDVGAYSSRPGAADVSQNEEMARLRRALHIVRRLAPSIPGAGDTFRASVAKMAVEEEGADIINDISAGEMDKDMFRIVAQLRVPYIMMHMQGSPASMQNAPHYEDVRTEVVLYLARRIDRLAQMGVNDIITDPGFGFGKTLENNYCLMAHLSDFLQLHRPLLVGISRKSMIYKLLDCTPQEALNGTTVLNTIALQAGANILRVHDVKAAVEARNICLALNEYCS